MNMLKKFTVSLGLLAALFMAARLIGNADAPRQIMIKDAVDAADELLRQVPL